MSAGDSLFYFPSREEYGRPEDHGLAYESVDFISADGTALHGWFFPAEGKPAGTVVHLHGNGGNITGHFEHVHWLPGAGWNLFCFDYRGYGRSAGAPTRRGTVEDAAAAVTYTCGRDDVQADRVVLLGQSLGGAIGIVVAADAPEVRGLAVEGAFSDYRTEAAFVAGRNLLFRPLARWLTQVLVSNGLDPVDYVARISPRPTFFICGTEDRIVDHRQTIALYEAAGEPKSLWVIDGGRHTGAFQDSEGRRRVTAFFEQCVNGVRG